MKPATNKINSHALKDNSIAPKSRSTVTLITNPQDGIFTLKMATQTAQWAFRCTASEGGRIISFMHNGHEILVSPDATGMFGSTFWPSPENWGWPPPTPLDADDYVLQPSIQQDRIILHSSIDPKLHIQVTKAFVANPVANSIDIQYGIVNHSKESQYYAPWEITRVPKGGLTFYPKGTQETLGQTRGEMIAHCEEDTVWYSHPINMQDDGKIFDSSANGWIAHTNGKLLFIKTFEPAHSIAPGEGEIEIYACPRYVEVEQQGSYIAIKPNQTSHWNVRWYLRELPSQIETSVGNANLVSLVNHIISEA